MHFLSDILMFYFEMLTILGCNASMSAKGRKMVIIQYEICNSTQDFFIFVINFFIHIY